MLRPFVLALSLWLTYAASAAGADTEVKNVAIIGAGAGGASAAYYLRQFAAEEGIAVNITVFEKTARVGGRTLTVNVYDNPMEPVELGASIFVKINEVLYNASQQFGLPLKDAGSEDRGDLAVWDGDEFVYYQAEGNSSWWNYFRLFWKYGRAPYKAQSLIQSTIATFLKMYKAPYFPFRSLTTTVFMLELTKVTGVTGEQFLAANGIDTLFSNDIIQAATRVNYASNLAYIHGLETMVSMAPDNAVAVAGGNWQIFEHMLRRSNATVHRNTPVVSLALDPDNDPLYPHTKYVITTKSSDSATAADETHPLHFDNVIIATPWQFSNISAADGVFDGAIDVIPYTKLHVTLFASPFTLAPTFFGLEAGVKSPGTVLTTLAKDDTPMPGAAGVGKTGFYSISTLRTITNPNTLKEEYLYKIFSPEEVKPDFLSSLLGVTVPETFTRSKTDDANTGAAMIDPISWYYPHSFYSYPIELPRVTFQDPILRGGLYYTSGIESFISTMETSGLMGMNVARLIADDFLAQKLGLKVDYHGGQGSEGKLQDVLGGTQTRNGDPDNATAAVMDEL